MEASRGVRKKLVLVIGSLIGRCIEEARKVPYVLDQDQVVDILVENPAIFAELVHEEHRDRTEIATGRLTAKIDALTELGQFEALDAFDVSFSGGMQSDADLAPVLETINRLTRTFVVYIGNMVTIFEKEFRLLMERFRKSLRQAGVEMSQTELKPADLADLEKRAAGFLAGGQFLQALSFDRLLNSQVISNELVRLPGSGYSFNRNLLKSSLMDAALFPAVVKFVIRASYVSQGAWQDNIIILVNLVGQESEAERRSALIDRIEQDGVFCCNLLRESFANLKKWPPVRRREAIEAKLGRWKDGPGIA